MDTMSKGERTRQMIIEKAAEVLSKNGVMGTSIRVLSKEIGLTSGAIYGGFSGKKDEIIQEAFDFNVKKVLNYYRTKIYAVEDPRIQLMNLLNFPIDEMYDLFKYGCPILNMATEADDTLPFMREKVNKALKDWGSIYEEVLQSGIDQGYFKPIDTKKYSLFIISAIEGAIMISKSTNDFTAFKSVAENLKASFETQILIG